MKWLFNIVFLFLVIPVIDCEINAQDTLLREGQVYVDSLCDVSYKITVPQSVPVKFIFRNNSVTGCNIQGYMLEAGMEVPSANTNTLRGAEITGNKFTWVGDQDANTNTQGIFTGYNTDVKIMYNYVDRVPMSIIRKGNGLTDAAGVIAYNIVVSPPVVGVVVKGMNGVRVYNNTFFSDEPLYVSPGIGTTRGLIDIYTNTDTTVHENAFGYAKNTKVKNNIFYTVNKIPNINIISIESLEGFECDNNIYWCESGEPMFRIAGTDLTFTQWQARGYDTLSMVMNPHFKDFVNFVPEFRLQWGTPTEFDMGIAMSDYWSVGFDPFLVKQDGYWQQGARIYEGDVVIFYRGGRLIEGDSTNIVLRTGKVIIKQGELRIEQNSSGLAVRESTLLNELVAYWKMDETSGTSMTDATGNGHTGTIDGATINQTGIIGRAYSFDGVDDKVTFDAITSGTSFAISMWVYPIDMVQEGVLMVRSSNGTGLSVYGGGADDRKLLWWKGSTGDVSTGALTNKAWNHVLFNVDNGTGTFYINGTASGTSTGVLSMPLDVMGDYSWYEFKGMIDEPHFYSRPLTTAEIGLLSDDENLITHPF